MNFYTLTNIIIISWFCCLIDSNHYNIFCVQFSVKREVENGVIVLFQPHQKLSNIYCLRLFIDKRLPKPITMFKNDSLYRVWGIHDVI